MSLALLLDTTCTVQRQVQTPDATGANVPTWTARLSNIACSIQPSSHAPKIVNDFGRMDFVLMLTVHTATALNATTADRIVINGGAFAGTYPVVGYHADANASITDEQLFSTYVIKRN